MKNEKKTVHTCDWVSQSQIFSKKLQNNIYTKEQKALYRFYSKLFFCLHFFGLESMMYILR